MIYIGTSGYNYKHWVDNFYPKDLSQRKWLKYYSGFFNTVELNVTFYRLPQEKAFLSWYKETPKDFKFCLKGSRFITHVKKLKDVNELVKNFMNQAKLLKEKLEVVLWQFPENFKSNLERLEVFLKILKAYKIRFAFEFRNESWFIDEVYELLKKYNYSLVIADSSQWPYVEKITSNFLYLRFHGGQELYGSKYSEKELETQAKKIKDWQRKADVYVYFNNDFRGFAVENALKLKELTK